MLGEGHSWAGEALREWRPPRSVADRRGIPVYPLQAVLRTRRSSSGPMTGAIPLGGKAAFQSFQALGCLGSCWLADKSFNC
jgi:hypothetical protein